MPRPRSSMTRVGRAWDAAARGMIRRSPAVKRFVKADLVQQAVQTTRAARAVREPAAFALRQLGSRRTGAYRLRESGLAVTLRHRSLDVYVVSEVFHSRTYEPPPAAAAILEGRERLRALDLGGNIGLFALYVFGRYPGAEVVSVEADPDNARLMRRNIELNGLESRWQLREACAGPSEGTAWFAGGKLGRSHVTSEADDDPIEVPAVDAFAMFDGVDFLKIDIEGSEWSILGDERWPQTTIPVVALEFHSDGCPGHDPRATAVAACRNAGYEVSAEMFDEGLGMLWAWRS